MAFPGTARPARTWNVTGRGTSMESMADNTTWFVTGASRGLGLELVRHLLNTGHDVAATTRSAGRLEAALDGAALDGAGLDGAGLDGAGLDGAGRGRLLTLEVDLTDDKAVTAAVGAARERFGPIDVVVNNAGYGFLAAVEEVSDAEAREMFDVQIFGAWNVLRAVLPAFRERRAGHIINVSSILGLTAFPGWGLYCAGKYALEGLTEALAAEVADFGVKVNLVEPGYMRTDFLRPGSIGLPAATVEGYQAIRDMTEAHLAMPGTQLGDPAKAAAAIVEVAERGEGPMHQLLGSDSYELARGRIAALAAEVAAGHDLAVTTDIA
jgi:NAD(P)-dependent dehydrogenase (short-subunit alcohol dehydrogenase family)